MADDKKSEAPEKAKDEAAEKAKAQGAPTPAANKGPDGGNAAKPADAKPDAGKAEEKAKLTDAQVAALDGDGDGNAGGSLPRMTAAQIEEIKKDAYNEGYAAALEETATDSPQGGGLVSTDAGYDKDRYDLCAALNIVLRFPKNVRSYGILSRAKEIVAFVDGFPEHDQHLVWGLIRTIAEDRAGDVANGHYQAEIRAVFTALDTGEDTVASSADQRQARLDAAQRLGGVMKSNTGPVVSAPLDGDADQNAAASKLYGGQ